MPDTPNDAFDFDDWSALHRRDPRAFEARRQALLAIELARIDGPGRVAAGRALARYEEAAKGLPASERIALSLALMSESVGALGTALEDLVQACRAGDRGAGNT